MGPVLIAIPLMIVILIIVVVGVFAGDSNKHVKKLDTAKQLELERLRAETIAKIKGLKTEAQSQIKEIISETISEVKALNDETHKKNKDELVNENIEQQKQILAQIREQTKTVDEVAQTLIDYKKYLQQKHRPQVQTQVAYTDAYNKQEIISKKLVFNQKNLIRGLIANEYLNKRDIGRRR